MSDVELAIAIYAHHRRAKLKTKRRDAPVPEWHELEAADRERRVGRAARLAAVYQR